MTAGPDACSAYGDSAMEVFGDARDGSEDYCTDFIFDYPLPENVE